jgi:hypothetical protein
VATRIPLPDLPVASGMPMAAVGLRALTSWTMESSCYPSRFLARYGNLRSHAHLGIVQSAHHRTLLLCCCGSDAPTHLLQDERVNSIASIKFTLSGFSPVEVTVPLKDGVTDLGNIVMAVAPPRPTTELKGVCLDFFKPAASRNNGQVRAQISIACTIMDQ